MVVFKHIKDSFPQKLQIALCKSCHLTGQISRHISLCPVQAIGNDALSSHFCGLILCILFCRDRNPRDRHLLTEDRINTPGKPQLDRAADLAAIQGRLYKCGHNCTECTYIIKISAHIIFKLQIHIRVTFFQFFQ